MQHWLQERQGCASVESLATAMQTPTLHVKALQDKQLMVARLVEEGRQPRLLPNPAGSAAACMRILASCDLQLARASIAGIPAVLMPPPQLSITQHNRDAWQRPQRGDVVGARRLQMPRPKRDDNEQSMLLILRVHPRWPAADGHRAATALPTQAGRQESRQEQPRTCPSAKM